MEYQKDLAMSPVRKRRSRSRRSDEMIWNKHEHDMRMEEMKQLLDEKKRSNFCFGKRENSYRKGK
ncbi:unnamed protein product, partial [Allacma fusca]